jgi:hypothetical protein
MMLVATRIDSHDPPSDKSGEWAWKHAGNPKLATARVPARPARKGWFGCIRAALPAGFHGIEQGNSLLATESWMMAILPIKVEPCSNARAGLKLVVNAEIATSSESRSC